MRIVGEVVLGAIGEHREGNRPDRDEPRASKPRRKNYPRLWEPGAKAEAPLDRSNQRAEEAAFRSANGPDSSRREQVAEAGGALFSPVFQLLGALAPASQAAGPLAVMVDAMRKSLSECGGVDNSGRPKRTLTLPDHTAVDQLAQVLARRLVNR